VTATPFQPLKFIDVYAIVAMIEQRPDDRKQRAGADAHDHHRCRFQLYAATTITKKTTRPQAIW